MAWDDREEDETDKRVGKRTTDRRQDNRSDTYDPGPIEHKIDPAATALRSLTDFTSKKCR